MINENKTIELYNSISDNKIDKNIFNIILPKLSIIMDKFKLDEVETVELIDLLLEFKDKNLLDLINRESIRLLNKIMNDEDNFLDDEVYFSTFLKHLLFPYNLNQCSNEYDLLIYLSNFEHMIDRINKNFNLKDLEILKKYNKELEELVVYYHDCLNNIKDNILLNTLLSHIFGLFYFKLDDYNNDFELLKVITNRLLDNCQEFYDYCHKEKICDEINALYVSNEQIMKEYVVSEGIINFVFENKENKRKCK